ncbi:radical SAM/SPASM domain-containing protein [Curvivirga sp.]|uniref:radical SAM/SPASM domain-containing protein n=1 Tax=Curvivirga sp. TaxID=2856848 RepID=UPI003B59A3E7
MDETEGKISDRISKIHNAVYSETPPFPKSINIELNNVCNHSCEFCAYRLMEREIGNIQKEKLEGWLTDAYRLGSREIGLHSGAEPLASPLLEHFIKFSKDVGYEYVYISTNGSLASPRRMQAILDAGIDSIKFSINAGDRETYKNIHGKDHFDRVIENLIYTANNRVDGRPYLGVSFVENKNNTHSIANLRKLVGHLVDEFVVIPATNQSGQLSDSEVNMAEPVDAICGIPFNKVHISWEGFLRVCCNDYENLLAVVDLNKTTLEEAVYSEEMRKVRRDHLNKNLEGTLCYNCQYNCQTPVQPLNPDLYFKTHDSDQGVPVSFSEKILR